MVGTVAQRPLLEMAAQQVRPEILLELLRSRPEWVAPLEMVVRQRRLEIMVELVARAEQVGPPK